MTDQDDSNHEREKFVYALAIMREKATSLNADIAYHEAMLAKMTLDRHAVEQAIRELTAEQNTMPIMANETRGMA